MGDTRTIAADAVHVEAAKLTAQKVREVRDFLKSPVAVENVSS